MNKTTRSLFAIFSVLILSMLACGRTSAAVTASPPDATLAAISASVSTALPAGQTTRSLNHAGLTRTYILYIPASLDRTRPVPLVFVLHGGTGNAQSAIHMSGFNQVADQNGFAVVYPNGTGRLSDTILLTWNGGNCCAYAQQKNVDDVGFMRLIVTDLQAQVNLDPHRIYATGMSNGAILAQRLACQAADLFAAVAPVAGTLNFSPCQPSRPISVIEFHGTADQHIPYNGGYGPKSLVNVDFTSVPASLGFWVTADQCNPQSHTDTFADIKHETWSGCAGSSSLELYTVIGGGHAWPGGEGGWADADQPTMTISASQLIWEFFAAHPKP